MCYYPDRNKRSKTKKGLNIQIQVEDWVIDRLKRDFKTCNKIFNLKEQQLELIKDEWGNYYNISNWLINNKKLYLWTEKRPYFKLKSGRIYSNFVQLSSHIRLSHILLNNESIVEFDISNSFPLMLGKYCISAKPNIIDEYEFIQYCTDVLNGKFYTELQKRLNNNRNVEKKGNIDDKDTRPISRNETKELFQHYLNGNNNRASYLNGVRTDVSSIFKQYYPSIDELIRKLKVNKSDMYCELVKYETNLILSIVTDLYNTYPDIKILTCHDAIYVPKSFQHKTQTVWEKHLSDFTKDLPAEVNASDDIKDVLFGAPDALTIISEGEFDELPNNQTNSRLMGFDDDFWNDESDEWDF